ncbi:hypothetical protein STEG23_037372, partial [Scotinomys teguina]
KKKMFTIKYKLQDRLIPRQIFPSISTVSNYDKKRRKQGRLMCHSGWLRDKLREQESAVQAHGVSEEEVYTESLHSAQNGSRERLQTCSEKSARVTEIPLRFKSGTTQSLSLYFVRKEREAVSTGVTEKSILSHGLLDPTEPWRLGSEILPKSYRVVTMTVPVWYLGSPVVLLTTTSHNSKKQCLLIFDNTPDVPYQLVLCLVHSNEKHCV